jgi:hypothetical protein
LSRRSGAVLHIERYPHLLARYTHEREDVVHFWIQRLTRSWRVVLNLGDTHSRDIFSILILLNWADHPRHIYNVPGFVCRHDRATKNRISKPKGRYPRSICTTDHRDA